MPLSHLALAFRLLDAEVRREVFRIVEVVTDRIGFGEPAFQVRVVDAGRRREQVRADVSFQERRRLLHPVRIRRRVVDDGIPLLAFERAELAVAITGEANDRCRQIAIAPAAREDRDSVSARDRMPHEVRTDEAGPAQDQDVEAFGLARLELTEQIA